MVRNMFAKEKINELNRKNPMRAEYAAKINVRRVKLGVTPLEEKGFPVDNSVFQYCKDLITGKKR